MKIKKFQRLSYIISMFFMIIIVFLIATLFFITIPYLFGWKQPYFIYKSSGLSLISASFNTPTFDQERLASLIVFPFIAIIMSYSSYIGYQFFPQMSEGETPFQEKFVKNIRSVGLLLMILSILAPIIYSLALSQIMPNGHHFELVITNDFFEGLFLYVISEIINYGVSLQELTDDTI